MTLRKFFLIIFIVIIFFIGGYYVYCYLTDEPPPVRISTMEGYVSRYNPGHITSAEALELARSGGAVILDLQSEAGYDERHVTGAVNVSYDDLSAYAEKKLTDKSQTIICYCFCGDMGGTALSAYRLLTELGYTNVNYAEPGDEWEYEETSLSPKGGIITGEQARAIYDNNLGAILLDVRNQDEYDEKHIENSVLIPVTELESRLDELPDINAVIIVYCKAGMRSAAACAILESTGYVAVFDMQSVDNWPGPLIMK